jgi:hypothetical protein
LKIPKGQSEAVNRRRAYNTMAKWKRQKNKMIYKVHVLPSTVAEYLCHKWPRMCSVCRNHKEILSSFIPYYRVSDKSKTTVATSGAETNEERISLWFRQTEHIRGHLWHRYSATVDQVIKFSDYYLYSL